MPHYLNAASATGFTVETIAKEGEYYPVQEKDYRGRTRGNEALQGGELPYIQVRGKDHIAVSIERPEGVRDHAPFWNTLGPFKPTTVKP